MAGFKVAAAQYPLDWFDDFSAYEGKMSQWVEAATGAGAKLLVFPEYGAMELTSLAGKEIAGDLKRSIVFLQDVLPRVDELSAALARKHQVFISAGTAPFAQTDGSYRNIARLFAPSGTSGRQEKRVMTRFERERWHIAAGDGLNVFDTPLGKIGIAICYDAEFPLGVRALVEAGAQIILVPSCTDTFAGYSRVRVACAARALENQCYVVQAPTVGEVPWSPAVDMNVGSAGLFGPPDLGFPGDGTIEIGPLNAAEWIYGEIDLQRVEKVRREGAVFNYDHWREQPGAGILPKANVIALS
jgi:predicted amidohydrolase